VRPDRGRGALGGAKRYDGYRSFAYLESGTDYRAFDLAPQIGRVEPFVLPLDASQDARAHEILTTSIAISLHEHCGIMPADLADNDAYVHEGREHYGYEGLAVSGLDAVFENMMDGTGTITSKMGWKWSDVIHDLGMHLADVAHQSMVFTGSTVDDIERAHRDGRIAMIPAMESATPIENELDRLDVLYGLGVRMMGVAYSESNALGGGLKEVNDGGLTQLGRAAIVRMNKLGMAVDVSHAGTMTALDVCKQSSKPVFISHAGARALWDIPRMKPDHIIKAVAETGGVMGIEAAPHTTLTAKHPMHSLESVMEHFEYCVDLVGIDHVTFGPDTIFGDHVGFHEAYAAHMDAGDEGVHPRAPYVEGLENITEFPNVVRWLVAHRYGDEDIRKAIGGNTLRALREAWI
jgi:membrane dipeptidase